MHDILKYILTCSHKNMTMVAICSLHGSWYDSDNRKFSSSKEACNDSNFLFTQTLSLELAVIENENLTMKKERVNYI